MRRAMLATVIIGLAGLASGRLAAQDNPLLGLWQHSEVASDAGPGSTAMVAFADDGTYETRMAVPPTAQGLGAGMLIVKGQYHLSGPNSYVYHEVSAQMCAAGTPCVPSPMPLPNFGEPKTIAFQLTGPRTMSAAGLVWYRVQ